MITSKKALDLYYMFQNIRALTHDYYKIEETYDDGMDSFTLFTYHRNYVFKFAMEETYHEGKTISKFLNLEKVSSYSNVNSILNEHIEYEDYSHDDKYFNKVLLIKNLLTLSMEASKEWKDMVRGND